MRSGLTQRQFAERIGITQSLLCQYERGWYARAPKQMESKLIAELGAEWNFARLMEEVPDLGQEPRGTENEHL